jgi:RHS repeat-associated protein
LHYPSNAVVTYTPGAGGVTLQAIDSGNNINYVTGATYDASNSLTGFVSGSGGAAAINNSFSYNKRLQPVNMSATFGSPVQTVFSINYDFHVGNGTPGSGTDNGNVWAIANNKDNTRSQAFTYDPLNRLISAQNSGTDCGVLVLQNKTKFWGNSYGYDAWGNLLHKDVTKCSPEFLNVTADKFNRIHASAPDYRYDAAGNMTTNVTDAVTAVYDPENRISTATKNLITTTYTYDGNGNRVRKSTGNTPPDGTLYWYMAPGVMAETDLAGTTKSEYIFFAGDRVARRDGATGTGGVFYYFSDFLNTASVITDSAGVIKDESDYYPWGGELQFVDNDSNHYKFTGKERDEESGLDDFGARYYSNKLGRWVSSDWSAVPVPVPYADFGDPQTLNQYGYVRNAPTVKADADGHCEGDDCQNIQVSVAVKTQPTISTVLTTSTTDVADVGGELTYRFTYKTQPLVGTEIHEDVANTNYVNGQLKPMETKTADDATDWKGEVVDNSGMVAATSKGYVRINGNEAVEHFTQNVIEKNTTQTLTFKAPDGTTCTVTETRTMTNADANGKASSTYTITPTSPQVQTAKAVPPPPKPQPPPPPKPKKKSTKQQQQSKPGKSSSKH